MVLDRSEVQLNAFSSFTLTSGSVTYGHYEKGLGTQRPHEAQ